MIGDVRDKAVLVVGGTRGIGLSIARRLAQSGATVGITGRDAEHATEIARSIGERTIGYGLDVRDRGAVERVIAAFATSNRADGLVYSAGISPVYTSSEKLDREAWDAILAVNLTGAFACAQAFARGAIDRGAPSSIVFIGSIAGIAGAARLAAYAASKAGLTGLTKTLAWDWARYRIRVNVLAPGWVQTDMTAGMRTSESLTKWIESRTPQGRMASPDEIADLAVFLISDSASFATGSVLTLDGGWTSG